MRFSVAETFTRGAVRVHMLVEGLADVPRHNEWLTASERARLSRLHVLKRRSDWRLGRWTAKRLIHGQWGASLAIQYPTDIEIRAAEDGAPVAYVHGQLAPLSLSISHSEGIALCAATESAVSMGCDVESVAPRSAGFVADFFTPGERSLVERDSECHRPVMATAIWSAKESVLKAVREGLRRDTRSVDISLDSWRASRRWQAANAACRLSGDRFEVSWRCQDGYIFAFALGDERRS